MAKIVHRDTGPARDPDLPSASDWGGGERPILDQLRELVPDAFKPGFVPFRITLQDGQSFLVREWSECIVGHTTVTIWVQKLIYLTDIAAIDPAAGAGRDGG